MKEGGERVSAPATPRQEASETLEKVSTPETPRTPYFAATPPISAPPSQFHSPSLSRSPLLTFGDQIGPASANKTPFSVTPSLTPRFRTPRFITPIGSPLRRVLHLTKLDPHDAWLPITESRNGNAFYAAFHTLCSGIGIQALVLPVAFTVLGWTWGIICLTVAFVWQLYTLYLLVHMHESPESGIRYSRYMQLASAAFGEKQAKWLVYFPILYLAAGTCSTLIIIGGNSCKTLFQIACGENCSAHSLTTVEWYLVFTTAAVILSQLPNLNSIAGVSLLGAITAVGYCTIIWVVSVAKGKMPGVSYDPIRYPSDLRHSFNVLNALGIIAFAFRGHNLTLEIQATMPSSEKRPSRWPMWRGVKAAYAMVAACLFPLAIGGYWAYGQMIPEDGGMLTALYAFHGKDTSDFVLGLTTLFVIITCLSSFQIYGMPMFDDMESGYTRWKKAACPWWIRASSRVFFGYLSFFIGVAIPFVSKLAGFIGGVSLPVTLAYPCFMWLALKKPRVKSPIWIINWALGIFGLILSVALVAASIYVIVDKGIKVSFFNP